MSFQIHNSQGKAISIEELDKEACEFWQVENHPKYYASPIKADEDNSTVNQIAQAMAVNWFDIIGWAIHHPENYTEGWNDVRCTLWTVQAKSLYAFLHVPDLLNEHIEGIKGFLAPYYNLISHWESKGYKPVKVH